METLSDQICAKQLERRKQEDELKRVIQQEENFERIKVNVLKSA